MKIGATRWATLLTVYLLSFGCQRHVADKEVPPFQIVAMDTGFEAPDRLAAGCVTSFWRIAEPKSTKVCSLSSPMG